MAGLRIEGEELVVELSGLEKLGGLTRGVRVPLSAVTGARQTDEPYAELRGIRVGTGIPWVIVLGRMVYVGGTDFVAVYGTGRTAVIDLRDQRFRRLLVSGVNDATVDEIRDRVG